MKFNIHEYVRALPELDLSLRMPAAEFAARAARLRQELEDRGLDAAVAYGTEYRPGDTGWLTGYDPHIEHTIVVMGPVKVLVLGSPDALRYAKEMMRIGEFRCLAASGIPDADYPGYQYVSMGEALAEACGRPARDVGLLTPPDVLTWEAGQALRQAVAGKIVPMSDLMADLRYIKSEQELRMMRVAARLSTWGMQAMLRAIEPGVRELQVAACADYAMKYMGADRLGFTSIVMSGDRVTGNIGRATERVMRAGDMVVLGTSARYEGLTSALGRTVVVGGASADQAELIRHAARAHELAVGKLVRGGQAREVDLASRGYLKTVGLAPMYNVGHGIGWTEVFEKGIASQHSTYCFPASIAIQVDVGIVGVGYKSLPADGVGLRLEDPYLIDPAGKTERLTGLPLIGDLPDASCRGRGAVGTSC